MVDWDRVEELRSKDWDWNRIAGDPKVGFHPDASVHDEGRALRGLYHRRKSQESRRGDAKEAPSKKEVEAKERRWTLARIGFLTTPILGIWFLIAYFAPSPVGLILPAIPWLALGLAVAAFVLLFGLWRSSGARWSKLFRSTLIYGVVFGLVISGVIGLAGYALFGCPYLPPASSLTSQSASGQPNSNPNLVIPAWTSGNMRAWQDNGRPVLYFYGSSLCPYCSAASWAIYKALTQFGSLSGVSLAYSSPTDTDPNTPEVVLANVNLVSSSVAFEVSEDTSGPGISFPGTSSCYQQAYVTAYSGSAIPFVAINGQYIHGGSQLIAPTLLNPFAGSGAPLVQSQVLNENGSAWGVVQTQAWWIMAFLARSTGTPVATLASEYSWSSATRAAVTSDLSQIV